MIESITNRTAWIGLLVLLCFTILGCETQPTADRVGPSAAGVTRITEAELQDELAEYADRFSGLITATANDIAANSPQRSIRKTTLLWKLKMVTPLQDVIFGADPQAAFLDAATLTVQMRKYLESPESDGATLFADAQPQAVAVCLRLEDDIFRIGALFLNEQQLQTLRTEVEAFSDANPIRGTFSLSSGRATSTSEARSGGGLDWVTKIPMSPFRALEGIDAGASAISDFNTTANQFSQIVEDLPQQTRWQIELLWYELEERESVASALQSFNTIAESSKSLALTTQNLPTEIREQLNLAFDDLETRQDTLHATMAEARETLTALDETVTSATTMIESLNEASAGITRAGEAWRKTIGAVNELTQAAGPKDPSVETPPFDIGEYTMAADRLTAAAGELRALLAETRDALKADEVSALSNTTLQDAERRGRSVTDHAAWRVLQLMAIAFVLLVFYRLIASRLSRRQPQTSR